MYNFIIWIRESAHRLITSIEFLSLGLASAVSVGLVVTASILHDDLGNSPLDRGFFLSTLFDWTSAHPVVAFLLLVVLFEMPRVFFRLLGEPAEYETMSQRSQKSEYSDSADRRIERLQREISELRMGKQTAGDISLITREIQQFVRENLLEDVLRIVDERHAVFLDEKTSYQPVRIRLEALSATLSGQRISQSKRANFNLVAGIVVAILGLSLLTWLTVSGYMDLQKMPASGIEQFAVWYIPKLTLVFVIEAFSYFFLSLYRSGLGEVKFFQNEITNLESRIAAAYAAIGSGDNDSIRLIIDRLANTERNFVLRKGERSVSEQPDDGYPAKTLASLVKAADSLAKAAKALGSGLN